MQTLLHGLPVFVADIDDEDCGIKCISLVTSPAVESEFLAFKAHEIDERFLTYSVIEEEQRRVLGVVMRANYPIYRNDSGEQYFIMYRPEAIKRMAEKYLREGRSSDVNLQHMVGSDVEGVDMVQWYIKDTAKGIAPKGFEDIEEGSLFAEFHVNNEDVWQKIKDGTFRGFSLEGIFNVKPSEAIPSEEKLPEGLTSWIHSLTHSITLQGMQILDKVRQMLAAIAEVKMGAATTKEGVLYWEGDGELAVGDAVFIDGDGEERVAAPDGDYTFEDGHVVTIEGGKVAAITEAPEAPVEEKKPEEDIEAKKAGEKCEDEETPEAPADDVPDYAKDAPRIWEAINDTKHRIDVLREAVEELMEALKEKQDMSAAKPAHEEFAETPAEQKCVGRFARIAEIGKSIKR